MTFKSKEGLKSLQAQIQPALHGEFQSTWSWSENFAIHRKEEKKAERQGGRSFLVEAPFPVGSEETLVITSAILQDPSERI